jgi:hypothetical protein
MSVPNAIYYTEKLHPIPVRMVKRSRKRACIQINSGRLFDVEASRLIPILPPLKGIKADVVIRTRPPEYLSIVEYYNIHNLEIDDWQRSRMSKLCGWECRKAQTASWRGKFQIMFYPERIIDLCYKKMISEVAA